MRTHFLLRWREKWGRVCSDDVSHSQDKSFTMFTRKRSITSLLPHKVTQYKKKTSCCKDEDLSLFFRGYFLFTVRMLTVHSQIYSYTDVVCHALTVHEVFSLLVLFWRCLKYMHCQITFWTYLFAGIIILHAQGVTVHVFVPNCHDTDVWNSCKDPDKGYVCLLTSSPTWKLVPFNCIFKLPWQKRSRELQWMKNWIVMTECK